MSYKDIDEKIILLLAFIYNKVKWSKMKTNKNIHDIFNHRVRSASRRASVNEFVSKLSNYFGIQSLPSEVLPIIDELQLHNDYVLNKIYNEHIPICLKSIVMAKDLRMERLKGEKEKDEDIQDIDVNSEIDQRKEV